MSLPFVAVRHAVAAARPKGEGPGFDTANVTNIVDPAGLASDERRGLVLIKLFMDEISFNAQGDEITLVKRRDGKTPASTGIT